MAELLRRLRLPVCVAEEAVSVRGVSNGETDIRCSRNELVGALPAEGPCPVVARGFFRIGRGTCRQTWIARQVAGRQNLTAVRIDREVKEERRGHRAIPDHDLLIVVLRGEMS